VIVPEVSVEFELIFISISVLRLELMSSAEMGPEGGDGGESGGEEGGGEGLEVTKRPVELKPEAATPGDDLCEGETVNEGEETDNEGEFDKDVVA
jgi:hypothetical protein